MKYSKFIIRLHTGSKEKGKELRMMSNLYLSDYEHGGIGNNEWLESEVDRKQGAEMSMFLHIDGKFRWFSNHLGKRSLDLRRFRRWGMNKFSRIDGSR